MPCVHSLNGSEIPAAERLFLLAPITGCEDTPEPEALIKLRPVDLDFFCDDNGFEFAERLRVEQLELGQAVPITDGICQEQTIVRVR